MGFFSRFEDRAEGMIEGSSGRGSIEPVKLAKRAAREMEREKMVSVGHEYAPTLYNVLVSPDDDERMSGYYPSLAGEVETYLTSAADRGGLVFDCPPLVRFIVDDGLKRGKFDIIAESVSPAIISELRHEEMVHYGIEEDIPMANSYSYEDSPRGYEEPAAYEQPSYGQDSYEQPSYDASPRASEPEPYRHEEPAAYGQRPAAEPARVYPPTNAPEPEPYAPPQAAEDINSERTTVIAAPQPHAALFNYTTQQHTVLAKERTTIGREKGCDVVIPDPSVSRHHAEILHNESGWLIRDTGSTNGLSVNGVATAQARVYNGDVINLGRTKLEFQED